MQRVELLIEARESIGNVKREIGKLKAIQHHKEHEEPGDDFKRNDRRVDQ